MMMPFSQGFCVDLNSGYCPDEILEATTLTTYQYCAGWFTCSHLILTMRGPLSHKALINRGCPCNHSVNFTRVNSVVNQIPKLRTHSITCLSFIHSFIHSPKFIRQLLWAGLCWVLGMWNKTRLLPSWNLPSRRGSGQKGGWGPHYKAP